MIESIFAVLTDRMFSMGHGRIWLRHCVH